MNNKLKEFDWIKTPEDWKEIAITHNKKNTFVLKGLIYAGIIIIVSLSTIGLVYAYSDSFREWLHQYFASEKIQDIESFHETQRFLDGQFLYYYYEDDQGNEIIDQMSIFDKGQFIDTNIQHYEGIYNNQEYSFDYYQRNDNIYTLNHKGYIEYTLNKLVGNDLYFGSSDANLCCLHMDSGEIKKITNDNCSVNFCLSPSQINILINKSDAYWTVYNIETKEEKKVEGLAGMAHSSEYSFLDDWTILCFDDDGYTRKINLKNMTYQDFRKPGLYPVVSLWYEEDHDNENSTTLVNMENQQTITIPYRIKNYNYTILKNQYLILEKESDIIICDLKNKKTKQFHSSLNGDYIDVMCLDEKYIIFANQNEYIVLTIEEIFSEL